MQTAREMLDDGWLPTLLDIEKWKDEDPQKFGGFGWSALEVPGDCPRIAQRMGQLGILFNERYATRMIGSETLEQWQVRLQSRFDCNVHVFERAYRLYEAYGPQMDEVIEGEDITRELDTKDGGTDMITSKTDSNTDNTGTQKNDTNGTSKTADTPDTEVNLSDSYADSIAKTEAHDVRTDDLHTVNNANGEQTTAYGRTGDVDENIRRRLSGTAAESVARSIGVWRDLDCEFIGAFENLFLNIFWY